MMGGGNGGGSAQSNIANIPPASTPNKSADQSNILHG